MEVRAAVGDIVNQHVDAIVNAANSRMRGGGGVDGAIHRAGGPAILEDCVRRFPAGLPTGQAGWTTAGEMPATWVIHTVGPRFWNGSGDRDLLAGCYRNVLEVADELGASSIAAPLIGSGAFGWPLVDAAQIAVRALREASTRVDQVTLVAYNDDVLHLLRQTLDQAPS